MMATFGCDKCGATDDGIDAGHHEMTHTAPVTLYFAYGMNMAKQTMSDIYPGATPVGRAYLPGWKLAWRMFADIERDETSAVPGVLWKLDEDAAQGMDWREGYPDMYDKTTVTVMTDNDDYEAIVYFMNPDFVAKYGAGIGPDPSYMQIVRVGRDEFGLPTDDLPVTEMEVQA